MAEQLLYTAEKSLKDHGDKVPAETKTEIEGKMSALKEVREKMTRRRLIVRLKNYQRPYKRLVK